MKRTLILILIACVVVGLPLVGCKKESDADSSIVKPMDDYRQEAADEIDAADAERELEKISREIDQDAP
ncbi:MAG: hypothetical protein ACYS8X_12655 [Planctomycetota bacterium]|jgi:uncharacterized protein YxeA